MLPGVAFVKGLHTHTRFARESAPSNIVRDMASALFASILMHVVGVAFLILIDSWFENFDLTVHVAILIDDLVHMDNLRFATAIPQIEVVGIYSLILVFVSFGLGRFASGHARWLVRGISAHKWVEELREIQQGRNSFVSVYIMTKIQHDNSVLMYKGFLVDFYFNSSGQLTYLLLKTCFKFYVTLNSKDALKNLEGGLSAVAPDPTKDHPLPAFFLINGDEIANAVFERVTDVVRTDAGVQLLARTIEKDKRDEELAEQQPHLPGIDTKAH